MRQSEALVLLGSLALLFACSAAPTTPDGTSDGGTGSDSTNTAGNASAGNASAGEASAPAPSGPDWCAARAVLQAKCQRCHAEPPQNGAPFALSTYADTQVKDRHGAPRFEKMRTAVESDYMPPQFLNLTPEVEPLADDERSTLLGWLATDPPLDAPDCE